MLAHDMARKANGRFLLRIEDIDQTRSKPEWEDQIYTDLHWLGLTWDAEPVRQSNRLPNYISALRTLWERGLLYPCSCTRRDILAASSAPQEGAEPAFGPDGLIYPGTCRSKPRSGALPMPEGETLRLDVQAALAAFQDHEVFGFTEDGEPVGYKETRICSTPRDLETQVGDIVLSRKDFPGSYHLSVVLDDADQGITHVIRGADLFDATQIHVLLQLLLGLRTPHYFHHSLIRDENGKRLAKRDDARAIAKYREDGATPQDIRRMVGL